VSLLAQTQCAPFLLKALVLQRKSVSLTEREQLSLKLEQAKTSALLKIALFLP
jgi:hypothetical protein